MLPHLHMPTKRRIDRHFGAGFDPKYHGLDAKRRTRMVSAVERCPRCAAYFRTMQAMESSLCGTDDLYTHFSIERTEKALFETFAVENEVPATKTRLRPHWVFAPTAAVAAACLFFLFAPTGPAKDRVGLPKTGSISPVTLIARGAFPKKAESDVGFRVFRVTDGGAAVMESGDPSINDIITFTYTQANEPGGAFMLLGIQETGDVKWYYPSYGEKESIAVQGDKVDEPLKDGILLSVNHVPGKLRITAFFSKTPIQTAEVEAAVAAMRKNQKNLMSLSPIVTAKDSTLPIQVSVIVNIGGGE